MTDDPPSFIPRVRRPRTRLRAGRFMQGLAVAGVLVGVAGVVVGWQLMGEVDDSLDDSLELTGETLVTLEATIELADDVVDSVDDGLVATEMSLDELVVSFGEADEVVTEVDTLVSTVGPSVDDVAATLRDLADIGDTIDDVLSQLDRIPFGPDYDPGQPLGAQFDSLAGDLDPIVESLESTSGELSDFAEGTDALEANLTDLADAVGALNADLQSSKLLLDSYLTTAQRAQGLTAETRSELGDDVRNARILIVIGGIIVAMSQIVPFWVGKELELSAREQLAGELGP